MTGIGGERGAGSGVSWSVVRIASGRTAPRSLLTLALALALGLGAPLLSAQAGHDPAHSPYHDIQHGNTVRLVAGYLWGSRGDVPVGPSDGALYGIRDDYPISNVLTLVGEASYVTTTSQYVSPFDSVPVFRGPVSNPLVLVDGGARVTFTGAKTWHSIAPYVGVYVGFAIGGNIAADTSGNDFGTKFLVSSGLGFVWHPANRFSVDTDFRLVFWKLSYPPSYQPKLIPFTKDLGDWTTHPTLTIGAGWTF
ncbi:MAG TPA: hypothetical protein VMH88_15305 [Gemmatimonadales bacterium]|nr:hypothetical protein [Gemmatimonadales bacterium]